MGWLRIRFEMAPQKTVYQFLVVMLAVALLVSTITWRGAISDRLTGRYLRVFEMAGWDVSESSQMEKVFSTIRDGAEIEVVKWHIGESAGIQILRGDKLITDPDFAFDVLLSLAWSTDSGFFGETEIASLKTLAVSVKKRKERYSSLFTVARTLEPVVEAIDRLQDVPIFGVPRIEVRGFPILEVNNAWDLLCAVPIDATDFCLLEPLARELHKQGQELEQLLIAASADLDAALLLLEERKSTNPPTGLALKEATERSLSSLRSLERKVDETADLVKSLEGLSSAAAVKLRSRQWGPRLDAVLGFLATFGLGNQLNDWADGLASKLENLAQQLSSYLADAESFSQELGQRVGMIEEARLRIDERVLELGKQWRARPISP